MSLEAWLSRKRGFVAGCLLALGAIGGLAWLFVQHPPAAPADWAAWVQGVGTIAAVAVAVWAGTIPAHVEAERARREERKFCDHLEVAINLACGAWDELAREVEQDNWLGVMSLVGALQSFDVTTGLRSLISERLTQWPNADLFIASTALQFRLDAMRNVKLDDFDPRTLDAWGASLNLVRARLLELQGARQRCEALIRAAVASTEVVEIR